MEHLDLLIVGAGWHGLAMAKTYLEACPSKKVAVVDSAASIGGTWALERLYPGLKTNNLVGSYEFSDFPLELRRYGMEEGQHIPGKVVHSYLCDFVARYHLPVRLQTDVVSAELLDTGQWQVSYRVIVPELNESTERQLISDKLVLATGLTSEPSIPRFEGQDRFSGPILHSKQLKDRAEDIAHTKTVAVLGGNKSAWDVSYNAAQSGVQVHMIMRPSGGGPSRVWPVKMKLFAFFKTSLSRLSSTRLWSWLDPSPFGGSWWLRWILHRTTLGRWICSCFWKYLDHQVNVANGYEDHPRTELLRPWTSTAWMGNSLGVHNYETSWFELVKQGKIVVHIADMKKLTEKTIYLSDGTHIDADMIVCCTGWKAAPTIKFLPKGLDSQLGLPTHDAKVEENKADRDLRCQVQSRILGNTPFLRQRPIRQLPQSQNSYDCELGVENGLSSTPFRLYRFLVPYEPQFFKTRNFAVIGAHLSIHATILAQAQALWITVFFQGRIDGLDNLSTELLDHIKYETFYHTEYERMRHPREAGGSGNRYPDLVFDSIPYVDMLLRDLGIRTRRKSSWWKEVFEPYRLPDYRNLSQR